MTKATIGFIPARAGSKALPNKNTRVLNGCPLYRISVDQALASGLDQVFVSTDIAEILLADLPSEVRVVRRPAEFAAGTTPMVEVLLDFLLHCYTDEATIVLLQPTSPLRKIEHICAALSLFHRSRFSLVMSVCETDSGFLKYGNLDGDTFNPIGNPGFCFSNRQSLPVMYRPNGSLYIFDAQKFRRDRRFPDDNIGAFKMTEEESVDIDTEADLKLAESIIRDTKNEN